MDCLFCNIAKKEEPAEIVHETGTIIVFKTIKPNAPVHLLIIPKKHVVSIQDLKDEDRDMVVDMIYIAKAIAAEQGLLGYRLCFNVGREGGQIIDHLHLHLLGGWKADNNSEL